MNGLNPVVSILNSLRLFAASAYREKLSVGIGGGMRLDIISTRFLFIGLDDFHMPFKEHSFIVLRPRAVSSSSADLGRWGTSSEFRNQTQDSLEAGKNCLSPISCRERHRIQKIVAELRLGTSVVLEFLALFGTLSADSKLEELDVYFLSQGSLSGVRVSWKTSL